MTDVQSSLTTKIINANPHAYEALVVEGGTLALAREQLAGIQPEQLFSIPIQSPVAAHAMLAGLWLWHDGLSECHEIVQKSPLQFMESDRASDQKYLREMTSTFAYWHAIMHRREGDFSNSKYWLARCRSHASGTTIAQSLPKLIESHRADPAVMAVAGGGWNPFAFVDLAEQVHGRPGDGRRETAIAIQRLEWRILFNHCAAAAMQR
jgi:hypothetical protein